jgi:glycosyltransferase involved in cell wall biosynthesis
MLKVLLINNRAPASGIGVYATQLFSSLKKVGNDIAFIEYVSWNSLLCEILFQKALQVNNVAALYSEEILRIVSQSFFILKISRKFSRFHICHIVSPALAFAMPLMMNAKVVTVHDLIPFLRPRSVTDLFIRKSMNLVKNAERIICISESTKKDLLHFIDVDPRKVRVIYSGIDHELFKPRDKLEARRRLGLPLDRPIILNVGSEEPRKNIPTLIKAFGILVKDVPNAVLIRVGSPTNTIEKLIHGQGLEGKIIYLKPNDEDLSLLYTASDVFVFPSYYEGLGLPLLEAMASGCPVVAGNRSAIPEAVGDGGILLDPFDVDGFAYWMREVLSNEDLRIKLSEKGYRRSLNFSWEKCARETLEVYREVLNEVQAFWQAR